MDVLRIRQAIVVACLAVLTACGGSGGGGGGGPGPYGGPDWYVDALLGNDGSSGALGTPFKSITHALTVVLAGQTIHVAPGIYDPANGETFPLEIPPSVTLLGDEANKGDGPGTSDTLILGGGNLPPAYPAILLAAVLPRSGAVIAGFRIFNPVPPMGGNAWGLVLPDPGVTIRNNTIRESATGGVYMFNNAGAHTIAHNEVFGHLIGLAFYSGGVGSRVEFNFITENFLGVEFSSAGGDLGGGAAASFGGNSINCNGTNDVRAAIGVTVEARNNFWDHNPPTSGTGSEDLYAATAAVYVTTGAAVASSPCP